MRRALAAAVLAAALSGVSGEPAAAVPIRPPGITRPSIVWRPIPFGRHRRQQMGAYSRRHYHEWSWRLADPHVIVEHYTDGTSLSGAFNTFAANGSGAATRSG